MRALREAKSREQDASAMGKLSKAWRSMLTPTRRDEEQWSAGAYHCPRCGQELPAFRPGNRNRGVWSTLSQGELVRECPFDGRPPFNDKAKAMLENGTLPLTRNGGTP
jgi:hypothetical protein